MIQVKTNITVVSETLIKRMQELMDPKPLLRPVAVDVLNLMTQRIHEEGKAADGNQIGTYSLGYMKVRTGNFGNAQKTKSGKLKNAGFFTKGRNATFSVSTKKGDIARPKYNRTSDPKIVVSLTRQLENDWAVIATSRGWGIGFNNPLNAQKMRWVEAKKRKIAALTESERDFAINKLRKLINEKLTG